MIFLFLIIHTFSDDYKDFTPFFGLFTENRKDMWVFRSNGASDFGQTVPLKRSYNYIKKLSLFLFQYSLSQRFTFQVNPV